MPAGSSSNAHLLVWLGSPTAPLPYARLLDALATTPAVKPGDAALIMGVPAMDNLPTACAAGVTLVEAGDGGAAAVAQATLAAARRVVETGGTLAVAFMPSASAAARAAETTAALLLAGFVDPVTHESPPGVRASAPRFSVGASVPLKFARKNANANSTKPVAQVTLTADDLVDEDALLLDEDRAPPPAPADDAAAAAGGCGSNPRKACANCSCGRAEALAKGEVPEKPKVTKEMLENPQTGGCGSCGLGDAFRCAGCPYRGLPTFKPGEKIVLSDAYDLQLDA